MNAMDIMALIEAAQAQPTAPTKQIDTPWGQVTIARLSLGAKLIAATEPTPTDRLVAMLRAAVVVPRLTDAQIDLLVNNPNLLEVAQALTDAINVFNERRTPEEVVAEAHAAFRLRANEPDAPESPRPV